MVRLLVMALPGVTGAAGQCRALDIDLELHQLATLVQLRGDLEDGAHFLPLHGGERIDVTLAAAGIGVLAGDERDFLRHLDLRFLVVHGHGRRRRDQVGVRVTLQRADHGGEVHAGGRDTADAEGGAGTERLGRARRIVDGLRQLGEV
jgi:hypothetical protein